MLKKHINNYHKIYLKETKKCNSSNLNTNELPILIEKENILNVNIETKTYSINNNLTSHTLKKIDINCLVKKFLLEMHSNNNFSRLQVKYIALKIVSLILNPILLETETESISQ